MKKTYVEDVVSQVGKEVELYGWVNNVRDHKKIVFVDLRDRTGILQCVGDEKLRKLSPEDVVYIKGLVKERPEKLVNPKLKTGKVEVEVKEFKVIAKSQELPVDMSKDELNVTLPTLLDYRSLTLRHPKIAAIFKVQERVWEGFRKASKDLGCVEIFVPTIVASATEGGTEVFSIDYYDKKASLSQSPQLYKQMLVPVFERVYLMSHIYRAEPSVTTRHLAESTQMDCEFGFVDFEKLLDLLEKVGTEVIKYAEVNSKEELKLYNVEPVLYGKIPRLTVKEALQIIKEETGRDITNEPDLDPQGEIDIWQWVRKKHKTDFVTITHFPTKKKPFYTKPDPNNPGISLSYDLLFKGLELASGSQREEKYENLVSAIRERGMDLSEFEMYLMAFKYGMPPEGGFSFGLERMTKTILGLANVRESSLFPRDMERVDVRFSKKDSK